MWNRKDLKTNAKALLKANYWKVVVASLMLAVCAGSGTAASSKNASEQGTWEKFVSEISKIDAETLFLGTAVIFSVIAVALVADLVISLFVLNPLEVGAQKLLINCRDDKAEFGDIVSFFKNSYLNIIGIVFLRDIFIALWSMLFVIPGIIKVYEYRMIPYILAEHPEMSRKEVFAKSKEMMKGNKWNTFVLDLSFIGWHILGICTCGIGEIFYVAPYHNLTSAELYHKLKSQV